jgi:hypothetical protein
MADVLGPKFQKLIVVINEVFSNYKHIQLTVEEWEERQQMVDGKLSQQEEGLRKNILIFGLEERRDKGYFDALGAMMNVLRVNEAGGIEQKH